MEGMAANVSISIEVPGGGSPDLSELPRTGNELEAAIALAIFLILLGALLIWSVLQNEGPHRCETS